MDDLLARLHRRQASGLFRQRGCGGIGSGKERQGLRAMRAHQPLDRPERIAAVEPHRGKGIGPGQLFEAGNGHPGAQP
ncbi:hypothetical protein D3C87_1844490 [compost metagenome]